MSLRKYTVHYKSDAYFLDNVLLVFFFKDNVEKPDIMISGEMRVGNSVTVQCSVYHTCASNLPFLRLNTQMESQILDTKSMTNGLFKTTVTAKLKIEKEQQTVDCTVRHIGGQTAQSLKSFNAKCMSQKPKL